MFKGQQDAAGHAKDVASRLNDHTFWRSHSRRVDLQWLKSVNLNVLDLATVPALDAAVHAVHLTLQITFSQTGIFKIVTNSRGGTLIGSAQVMTVQIPLPRVPNQPGVAPPVQH